MPSFLSTLLQRFAERNPVPVMIRGVLERCVHGRALDEWFEQASEGQYTRHLLFSTVFDRVFPGSVRDNGTGRILAHTFTHKCSTDAKSITYDRALLLPS